MGAAPHCRDAPAPPVTTVPVPVAALALGEDRDLLTGVGRQVGQRVEIDLGALADLSPDALMTVVAYAKRCRALWGGFGTAGPVLQVEVPLLSAAQSDAAGVRDLRTHVDAFDELPGVAELVAALVGAEVDERTAAAWGAPYGLELVRDGNWTDATFTVAGCDAWPVLLGGAPALGELSRRFRLRINHAGWRDRAGRRLVSVEVAAICAYPDPQRP